MSDHAHRAARNVQRALNRITVEAVTDQRTHDAKIAQLAGGDMAQQVKLIVQGKVARQAVFLEKEVYWTYPFLMRVAGSQSDGTLTDPHFACGVEVKTERHVIIDAQIRRWIEDDSQFITGALVRVAVWAPDAPKLTPYSAVVHMTFFGYAAPAEDDTEG